MYCINNNLKKIRHQFINNFIAGHVDPKFFISYRQVKSEQYS